MAKQVKLKAEPRAEVGRVGVRKLKARGLIPAVIYGGTDKPQPLQVAARDINAMMSQASGENVLVELEIGGDGQSRTALVQEVQHSPVGGEIRHVDFHAISMDQMIEAEVPLEPVGTAVGVKTFGGLLEQSLRTLAIECLPGDLPDRITVDVSHLNIGDSIHVRDIHLPPGVTPKVQVDLTVLSVMAPVVDHGEEGRRRNRCRVCSSCKRKSGEGEGREEVAATPGSRAPSGMALHAARPEYVSTNPARRRSRKSRPGVRGHAAQHRVHGGRSAGCAIRIDLGEIWKMGRPLREMRRCASGQTVELYESQWLPTVGSCTVLQNRIDANPDRAG
jgi:large subunit ribosomal protein L25